ncbi:hypothetical protein RND81_09G090400 [Saponaria officinalis]|uniref:Agenet domain-containing protein n=1 Tax=Saponaria officinalis TaxID=3572 RepID=A0AAW1IJZ4_SAPOF
MTNKFKRGQQVEICSKEEGFENSYFPATIISEINKNNEYIVQFNTLLGEDEQRPLREFRSAADIRPVPPEIESIKYEVSDAVDAYANDGWWKGMVVKVVYGGRYQVKFDGGGRGGEVEVKKYLGSYLRVHQDWVDDHWVCSHKNLNSKLPCQCCARGQIIILR